MLFFLSYDFFTQYSWGNVCSFGILLHPISSWSVIVTKQTQKTALMAKGDVFNNLYWQGEKKLPSHENIWTSTNVDKQNKKREGDRGRTHHHVKFLLTKVKVFYIVAKSDI